MNLILDVVRDVVNGSKHFELDEGSANKRKVSEVHIGNEASWYSYFFHEGIPGVTAEKQWYFSLRVLNNIVMRYYEWVFDDSTPVREFPVEIIETITYCNISERVRCTCPALWLQGVEKTRRGAR